MRQLLHGLSRFYSRASEKPQKLALRDPLLLHRLNRQATVALRQSQPDAVARRDPQAGLGAASFEPIAAKTPPGAPADTRKSFQPPGHGLHRNAIVVGQPAEIGDGK